MSSITHSLYCINEGLSRGSLSKLTAITPLMFMAGCVMMSLYVLTYLQSLATWETENKIYCKQTLVDGDGPKTYWSRELKGDELILVRMDGWIDG